MRNIIEPVLDDYSTQPDGKWLTEFDWKKVTFGKLPFIVDGLFVAMYIAPLNRILLEDPEKTKEAIDVWFSDLIHEMYHAYQRHKKGIIRYFLCKIFLRNALESEAVETSLRWLELHGSEIRAAKHQ